MVEIADRTVLYPVHSQYLSFAKPRFEGLLRFYGGQFFIAVVSYVVDMEAILTSQSIIYNYHVILTI